MSLYGLRQRPWTCIYGERGDCDECTEYIGCPISQRKRSGDFSGLKVSLPPPPAPSVECCQKCASCWRAPTCQGPKEHFAFVKEYPTIGQSFKEICKAEARAAENFHNCLYCRDILSCKILRRAMTPPKPARTPWLVDHGLLKRGESFSLAKVLRRLAAILFPR